MPSWLSLYYEEPIALVRGEGRTVWDADGKAYLDLFGGILTTMTGYGIPEITRAIHEQADRLLHCSTLYLIEPQIELAERICSLAPVDDPRVFFTTSGTEATDAALLLATCYRRSNQVLAMRHSYHGRSFSAVAVTGQRPWSPSALSPLQVSYVYGPYRAQGPFAGYDDDAFAAACVKDLRNTIETTTAGDVACMIAEPIQGVGGFATPPDGLLGEMKAVLDDYGILFVADEVQTGWGRTGEHFWGIEAHGVRPDILTFAKGLGNGLSIGGVVARAEIMDSLPANSISTFGGNPLSTAGALANLDYLLEHDLQANALKTGHMLMSGLRDIAADHPVIGDVRGKGLMIGVELVGPGGEPDAAAAAAVLEACKRDGLLVGRGGLYGNTLRIAPPLTITEPEAERALAILRSAVAEAERATRADV